MIEPVIVTTTAKPHLMDTRASVLRVQRAAWMRLRKLMRKRKGRHLRPGDMNRWTRHAFHELGLHKLLGTVRYPGKAQLPRSERPPVSRVRETRMHGLKGGAGNGQA